MKDQLKILEKLVNDKNKELIIDSGGSQDAVHDIEWAIFEGIDIIDYDQETLNFILEQTNGNIDKSIDILNKCLDKSLNVTKELVNGIM